MRPVLIVDLICAGRAVLAAPPEDRVALPRRLLAAAAAADLYRRETGDRHPDHGDGTLASAARIAGLDPEPSICDVAFASALICVLREIVRRSQID